jgi:hypothetical protein
MGCFDVYCSLCGLPLNSGYSDLVQKWMYKCTLLLNNNKIIHGATESACNYHFYVKGKSYDSLLYNERSFIVVHTDCWKYVKKEMKIELKYSDFPMVDKFYKKNNYNFFSFNISYIPISKYWGQSFEVDNYKKGGYTLDNPSKNKFLGNFIKDSIKKLNIKIERQGPRVSATLYNSNDLLVGSDNNLWKISKNKWIKENTMREYKYISKIKLDNSNKTFLENIYKYFMYEYVNIQTKKIKLLNIPQLGEVSSIGVIIKNINIEIKYNIFSIIIVLLYNETGEKELEKLINNNFGLPII